MKEYIELIKSVLNEGVWHEARNARCLTKFGYMMKLDISETFPLLTTKRVYWKGVVEELLWFIDGCTDNRILKEKGVHIWDANGTREFLDSRGLYMNAVDDLGPIYGFQWRHFGASYRDYATNYGTKGVDQLYNVIEMIKNDPFSRRNIMSAWNPVDLNKMALPPCHVMCQFHVDPPDKLSCSLYQRSCDVGLGVPFNIASYSLLTYMIASITNTTPSYFVYFMGNTHIYEQHVEALKLQTQRAPKEKPKLVIKNKKENINDYQFSDFELVGYSPEPTIRMPMIA